MLSDIKRFFLLTRPYSWFSIAFVAILADVLVNGVLILNNVIFDVIFVLCIWSASNFFAEYFSRDVEERGRIPLFLPVFFLSISVILIFLKNMIAFPFLLIILLSLLIYSGKSKSQLFGGISFLVRGLMEVNIFIIILLFYNFNFVGVEWILLIFLVYFVTCGRNLIGDLRDYEFDSFTFPKIVGKSVTKVTVLIFYLISLFLVFDGFFSIIVAILLILFLNNYFYLHRILVLVNTFLFVEILFSLILPEFGLIIYLLFISVLLNFVYSMVPRKSNPKNVI